MHTIKLQCTSKELCCGDSTHPLTKLHISHGIQSNKFSHNFDEMVHHICAIIDD